MKNSKIFVHIGTHKTGTTTIQRALNFFSEDLKREKIIVIPEFPDAKELMETEKINNKHIDKYRQYIKDQTQKYKLNDVFLMSYEGLSGNIYYPYKNCAIIAEILSKVMEGFEVYIIVYLRRQDLFVESMYTQMIKEGFSISFKDYISKFDTTFFDWKILTDSYSKFFGKNRLIVKVYDKSDLGKNGITSSFADIIGITNINFKKFNINTNPGYSKDCIELAIFINKLIRGRYRKKVRRMLELSNPKKIYEDFNYFSPIQRYLFLSKYNDINDYVAKTYFYKRNELFKFDKNKYEKIYRVNNFKSIIIVTIRFMNFVILFYINKIIKKICRKKTLNVIL